MSTRQPNRPKNKASTKATSASRNKDKARNGGVQGMINNQTQSNSNESEEQEGLLKRAKRLQYKLKLGPHHKMERFAIMFSSAFAFLLLCIGLAFVNHRGDVATQAATQSLYTESFTFSVTGQSGEAINVYTNPEQNYAMLLFQFEDPGSMSLSAENYELFVTAEGKKSLDVEPETTFALFSTTGYGVITMEMPDNEPFPQEIIDVTIRSNKSVAVEDRGTGEAGEDEVEDATFAENDQAKVYFNPGADDVVKVDNLDALIDSPPELYTELIAADRDAEIHAEIETIEGELNTQLSRMSEYNNRVKSAGYEPPEDPWFVEGDYINEDGQFIANEHMNGAFVFDYHDRTIRDGYLNQVIDDMSEFEAYMTERSEAERETDRERQEGGDRIEELIGEDGSVLEVNRVDGDNSPSNQVAAVDALGTLQQIWSSYSSSKGELERNKMRQLLLLDADVRSQVNGFSHHVEDAAQFY